MKGPWVSECTMMEKANVRPAKSACTSSLREWHGQREGGVKSGVEGQRGWRRSSRQRAREPVRVPCAPRDHCCAPPLSSWLQTQLALSAQAPPPRTHAPLLPDPATHCTLGGTHLDSNSCFAHSCSIWLLSSVLASQSTVRTPSSFVTEVVRSWTCFSRRRFPCAWRSGGRLAAEEFVADELKRLESQRIAAYHTPLCERAGAGHVHC